MSSRRLRTLIVHAVLAASAVAGATTAPSATADPGRVPAPLAPASGQPCDDLDKLVNDPAEGWLVCTAQWVWGPSVTPDGVYPIGEACDPEAMAGVMASSTDNHLIWCSPDRSRWTLFRP